MHLAQVAAAMQVVLTDHAERIAREVGCCQRASPLAGAGLVQTLVLGFLAHPEATLEDLAQVAGLGGRPVSPQALDQRFGPATARCLEQLLAEAARQAVAANPVAVAALQKFTAVFVQDSTTVTLPDALQEHWRGCDTGTGRGGCAAVKFQIRFDLLRGSLTGLVVEQGRDNDHATRLQTQDLEPATLHLRDLGYFDLDVLAAIAQAGAFFLTRWQDGTALFLDDGHRLDLAAFLAEQTGTEVDLAVTLGVRHRLIGRLVAVRVPAAVAQRRRRKLRAKARKKGYQPSRDKLALCDWNIYLTNVPVERLSVSEVLALGRARWQVELLFKQWKSDGRLAQSRSRKPWRVVCEVFAKMLALVVQHWVLLVCCWGRAERSLRKAAKAVRRQAGMLAATLVNRTMLTGVLATIARSIARCARIERRVKHPSAFQVLQDPNGCGHQY
jgi:hypothetical protein